MPRGGAGGVEAESTKPAVNLKHLAPTLPQQRSTGKAAAALIHVCQKNCRRYASPKWS